MRTLLSWMPDKLRELDAARLRRDRREVRPLPEGACEISGRRLWNFASNDYLGLASDARVTEAASAALREVGVGARASALVTGRTPWHARLEETLARFEGQEAAILFPTGYAANVGTIAALIENEDIVFCDRLNHASLIDGCRLSGAKLRVFRHSDLETLERELSKAADFRRRLIVIDALFSMDGDVAPLRELCDLAERFDAEVLVDEAHGTGVFGELGRGVCEHLSVENRVAVRVGTLSKAIGTLGGFVAGPQTLIDWLWNKARPQVFSTALPPAICAAATTAIGIIQHEPELRAKLWRNCEFVRSELECGARGSRAKSGDATHASRVRHNPSASNSVGPIIPIVLGDPDAVIAAQRKLEERGCLVAAIRPPTVPQGTSRLRISLSAAHDEVALQNLVEALRDI
ncbi:MAG: 8-amino-7-oxononanoate synthase [Planctomycetaceae bacterium]